MGCRKGKANGSGALFEKSYSAGTIDCIRKGGGNSGREAMVLMLWKSGGEGNRNQGFEHTPGYYKLVTVRGRAFEESHSAPLIS